LQSGIYLREWTTRSTARRVGDSAYMGRVPHRSSDENALSIFNIF